jgi:predicted ribosomally synthesized peptide with SipW-like signal peptide
MSRYVLVLVVIAGVLAAFASGGSALFTSTDTIAANTFTAGTVIISTNPTTALVTFSNMAPGDQVTAQIVVSNTGSLTLRYAITSAATNADAKALMTQLALTIKSGVTTCTNAAYGATGTVLYGAAALGSIAGINVVGDPTAGAQAGDRTLAPAAQETLCFNVTLPTASGNTYQAATTTATFTFAAEQTANN